MKKLIALLLALVMVLSLVACGSSRDDNWDDDDDDRYEEREDEDEEDEDDAEDSDGEGFNIWENSEEAPALDLPSEMQTTFDLVDSGDILLQITDIDPNGDWGYTLTVYCENNTDQNLAFDMQDVAVNGRMCDPYWYTEVDAGTSAYEEIIFYEEDLDLCGVKQITGIQFRLLVYDQENWGDNYLVDEVFEIFPYGPEYYIPATYTPKKDHTVLFDTQECFMSVVDMDPDSDWGFTMTLYCENRTLEKQTFSMDIVSVNGLMCDPYFYDQVIGGCSGMYEVIWYSDNLEELGIGQFNDISFTMSVYEGDDYDYESVPLVQDDFTLYPSGDNTAKPYEHDFDGSEILVWEDDNIAMYILEGGPDYDWGYSRYILVTNKTDTHLDVYARDMWVNGYGCDAYWSTFVAAGKSCISPMTWYTSDLEAWGITEVELVEFRLEVYNAIDWYADALLCEDVAVNLT